MHMHCKIGKFLFFFCSQWTCVINLMMILMETQSGRLPKAFAKQHWSILFDLKSKEVLDFSHLLYQIGNINHDGRNLNLWCDCDTSVILLTFHCLVHCFYPTPWSSDHKSYQLDLEVVFKSLVKSGYWVPNMVTETITS